MVKETYPKKYIKRLFNKPNKADCKKCGEKMFLLPEDENPGKILFRCVSIKCGHIVDLTEYKSKYSINQHRLKKMNNPDNAEKLSHLSLTRTYYRLKNQYYLMDDETTYNPIERIQCFGNARTSVDGDTHKKLLEIIVKNIENGKNTTNS